MMYLSLVEVVRLSTPAPAVPLSRLAGAGCSVSDQAPLLIRLLTLTPDHIPARRQTHPAMLGMDQERLRRHIRDTHGQALRIRHLRTPAHRTRITDQQMRVTAVLTTDHLHTRRPHRHEPAVPDTRQLRDRDHGHITLKLDTGQHRNLGLGLKML